MVSQYEYGLIVNRKLKEIDERLSIHDFYVKYDEEPCSVSLFVHGEFLVRFYGFDFNELGHILWNQESYFRSIQEILNDNLYKVQKVIIDSYFIDAF